VNAPDRLDTTRLLLRRPQAADVPAIFARYASHHDVTRLLSWPRHSNVDDTRAFFAFSDAEWTRGPVGPYLMVRHDDGVLIGSTGLQFETSTRASTGYVLAPDAWGHGYATEALGAMVELAATLACRRLHAFCHPSHQASIRVLEKCGFDREALLRRYTTFPNLPPADPGDVLSFARVW
jgi:[ribosomal protein S5]-alanine N-acetyltransferase